MAIIKDFAKKAAQKILGKIVPRNYEVGEPTGPGAEEALERRMPPRGQKKPAKPTSKGDEVRTEEPPKAPEQLNIEEPIQQRPSGQAPSVKHEEPARGEKRTPAGESSAPGKPTLGGGGKIPEGASTGKLTGFPAGAEGGSERINQYLEGIEKIAKSAWYEKGTPKVAEYAQKLIGNVWDIGGTAIMISGIALASLFTISTLADALGIKSDMPAPGVTGVEQRAGNIQPSRDIQRSTLSGGSRTCISAPRGSGFLTNKDPDCSDGRGGNGVCKKTYLNDPRTGKIDLYKGECTYIKRTEPVSGTDTCIPCN